MPTMRWQNGVEHEYAAKLAPHVDMFALENDDGDRTLAFRFTPGHERRAAHVHNVINDYLSEASLDDAGGSREPQVDLIELSARKNGGSRATREGAEFNVCPSTAAATRALKRLHAELLNATQSPWRARARRALGRALPVRTNARRRPLFENDLTSTLIWDLGLRHFQATRASPTLRQAKENAPGAVTGLALEFRRNDSEGRDVLLDAAVNRVRQIVHDHHAQFNIGIVPANPTLRLVQLNSKGRELLTRVHDTLTHAALPEHALP